MLPEIFVGDPADLAVTFAARLEDGVRAGGGRFSLAVSGGSVATTFFHALARRPIDWSRAHVFWCDERAVPPTHEDSNYAAARSSWLEPAQVPPASVHRMPADAADLGSAAAAYEAELLGVLGVPPRLDCVLLGVGPDGHVASLFPGHTALGEERRSVLAIEDSPKPPPRRLTLTLPVLAAARLVVVAAFGKGKADIVRQAVEDETSPLPLALVTRRASRVLLMLDADSASGLTPR